PPRRGPAWPSGAPARAAGEPLPGRPASPPRWPSAPSCPPLRRHVEPPRPAREDDENRRDERPEPDHPCSVSCRRLRDAAADERVGENAEYHHDGERLDLSGNAARKQDEREDDGERGGVEELLPERNRPEPRGVAGDPSVIEGRESEPGHVGVLRDDV